MLRAIAGDFFARIAQLLPGAEAEAYASFSLCAHASQHTSTVLPPTVTLMGFASSSQSQAAQVFSVMSLLSMNARNPGVGTKPCEWRARLSESLATSSDGD